MAWNIFPHSFLLDSFLLMIESALSCLPSPIFTWIDEFPTDESWRSPLRFLSTRRIFVSSNSVWHKIGGMSSCRRNFRLVFTSVSACWRWDPSIKRRGCDEKRLKQLKRRKTQQSWEVFWTKLDCSQTIAICCYIRGLHADWRRNTHACYFRFVSIRTITYAHANILLR